MRLRLVILSAAVVVGGAVYAYGTLTNRAIDRRLNEELSFAYDKHLSTVIELISYAREHAIVPDPALDQIAHAPIVRPNVRDARQFKSFERAQREVTGAARELITTLDGDLNPEDGQLAKLIRRFDSEERGLTRIRDRFARAGYRWSKTTISP